MKKILYTTILSSNFLLGVGDISAINRWKTPESEVFKAIKSGGLPQLKHLIEDEGKDPEEKGVSNVTPLHRASERGCLDIVKYLIEDCHCNADVNNRHASTPLHYAAMCGRFDIVKYLIEQRHCNTEAKDWIGQTPLHVASLKGHLKVVKYLIEECHVNIEAKDVNGKTPLRAISEFCWDNNKMFAVVKYLVREAHANIEAKDKKGKAPIDTANDKIKKYLELSQHQPTCSNLEQAINTGILKDVQYFIEMDGQKLEDIALDKNGKAPLHIASQNGYFDVVRYLVEECHCNVDAKTEEGAIPLHVASKKGHLDIVKYFIEKCHCNIEAKDKEGWTPLHFAAFHHHLDVVKYLIEEGHCDINARDSIYKQTVLHIVSSRENVNYMPLLNHIPLLNYLIEECHCDIEAKDDAGRTPLCIASLSDSLNTVRYLVEECHCNVEAKDKYGFTPLHFAALHHHLDIVKYLIEEGHCDINARDSIYKQTVLHFASSRKDVNHIPLLNYLIKECHCDIEAKDAAGRTPLCIASLSDSLSTVRYLVEKCHANIEVKNSSGKNFAISIAKRGGDVQRYLQGKMDKPSEEISTHLSEGNFKQAKEVLQNIKDTPLSPETFAELLRNKLREKLYPKKTEEMTTIANKLYSEFIKQENTFDNINSTLVQSFPDETKKLFLSCALKENHLNIVQYLVDTWGLNPAVIQNNEMNPLHWASKNGHLDMVQYLVGKCKMNVKAKTGKKYKCATPLIIASYNGHFDIVKYLVDEGHADVEAKTNDGMTPLHCAAKMRHFDIVKYLANECKAQITNKIIKDATNPIKSYLKSVASKSNSKQSAPAKQPVKPSGDTPLQVGPLKIQVKTVLTPHQKGAHQLEKISHPTQDPQGYTYTNGSLQIKVEPPKKR